MFGEDCSIMKHIYLCEDRLEVVLEPGKEHTLPLIVLKFHIEILNFIYSREFLFPSGEGGEKMKNRVEEYG